MGKVEFMSPALFQNEWVIDSPFIWERLKDDIFINVLKIKMNYLAEYSKLGARVNELQGKMYQEMAQTLGR